MLQQGRKCYVKVEHAIERRKCNTKIENVIRVENVINCYCVEETTTHKLTQRLIYTSCALSIRIP